MEQGFNPLYFGLLVLAIMSAIILHEVAHGIAALYFGDTTAKDHKRLSLNPLRHVDWFGTVLFPLLLVFTKAPFLFGWAKPVPVNFGALRNPKRDMIWVALAGPGINLILAVCAVGGIAVMAHFGVYSRPVVFFLSQMMLFNFSLMIFNLIPILPMDGGRVLTGILPLRLAVLFAKTERYGFAVLLSLLIFLPLIGDQIGIDLDIIGSFLSFAVKNTLAFFMQLFGIL